MPFSMVLPHVDINYRFAKLSFILRFAEEINRQHKYYARGFSFYGM